MTPDQRELYRTALLRVLEANSSQWGLMVTTIALHVGAYGFRGLTTDFTRAELFYLKDKGFTDNPDKTISPENDTWRITAAGRDWLAANG